MSELLRTESLSKSFGTEHTPIAIFVNGEMAFEADGRSVTFYSFPQGEGTDMVAEGVWTIADFRAVLAQETE